jgi:uncharacterized membrane protein
MVQLGDVLKAVGPNAAIVFAAWIFMGFLQQRYDSAAERFRAAVKEYRSHDRPDDRTSNLKDQIVIYRNRCRLMAWATLVGLIAAILLIASLVLGAADVMLPNNSVIAAAGIAALIGGFALVVVAAAIVIVEGRIVYRQIDDELRDVPDLADETGNRPGGIRG